VKGGNERKVTDPLLQRGGGKEKNERRIWTRLKHMKKKEKSSIRSKQGCEGERLGPDAGKKKPIVLLKGARKIKSMKC